MSDKNTAFKKSERSTKKPKLVLKLSKYSSPSSMENASAPQTKLTIKYIHKHEQSLVELGIYLCKEALMQF